MKALVGAFNQEKALVGAFSVIVQLHRLIDLRHYNVTKTRVIAMIYIDSDITWIFAAARAKVTSN